MTSPIFESKLLKLNQKGQPSKKQNICELSKLSKINNHANPNEDEGPVEVPIPFETELTIPDDDLIWLDVAEIREAMKVRDSKQVLLAVLHG
jgi:hypothetical protein